MAATEFIINEVYVSVDPGRGHLLGKMIVVTGSVTDGRWKGWSVLWWDGLSSDVTVEQFLPLKELSKLELAIYQVDLNHLESHIKPYLSMQGL